MSFTRCIVAWGLSWVGRGRKTVLTCFTCSSHKRCDVRADVMRTGHWYGEGDGGGVAWIRSTRLLPSEALPKDGCPLLLFFLFTEGSHKQTTKEPVISHRRTYRLLCPRPREETKRGGGSDRILAATSNLSGVFFKSLLKAQKKWKCHLRVNFSNLACRQMDGTSPAHQELLQVGRGSVGTLSYQDRGGTRDQTNQELDPDKGAVFYIRVLCVSCRGEHILNLFLASPLPLPSPPTPHRWGVGLGGGRV